MPLAAAQVRKKHVRMPRTARLPKANGCLAVSGADAHNDFDSVRGKVSDWISGLDFYTNEKE